MAVDIKITVKKTVNRKLKLSEETRDALDLYVEAAKEANPGVEDWQVVDALFQHHFSKDRNFKKWLKEKETAESSEKPILQTVSDLPSQAAGS